MERNIFKISNIKFILIFVTLIYLVNNVLILDNLTKWFITNDVLDLGGFIAYSIIGLALSIALFTILAHKYIIKTFAIFVIISSAASTYFISKYNVAVDRSMILNVWYTDSVESFALLSTNMIPYVIFLIIIPLYIVSKTQIIFDKPLRHIFKSISLFIIVIVIGVSMVYLKFNSLHIAGNKSQKYIVYQLVPVNFIIGIGSAVKHKIRANFKFLNKPKDIEIEGKVLKNEDLIVVLAIGETSRQKNFSLYGYKRNETNPLLSQKKDLYALNGIAKYGSTIYAIPNILSRDDIKLASISSKLGIKTTCFSNFQLYGNCGLVKENMVSNCKYGKCYDEDVILPLKKDLKTYTSGQKMIILHLGGGSHGPLYHKRYPPNFQKFKPMCKDADVLNKCTKDELYNSFDNTILYVDYVVSNIIDELEKTKKPYVFIFVSDHGESLLENDRIFHGMPPGVALPDEQAQIPLLVKSNIAIKIDKRKEYKQQEIYDTVLDLLSIDVDLLRKDKVFIHKIE
ncbi:MAG: phosphoethanolamine transferase [Arcobacter sp.]|nr:phosphoethanolamine transferase [Arcobacter sp.]